MFQTRTSDIHKGIKMWLIGKCNTKTWRKERKRSNARGMSLEKEHEKLETVNDGKDL